MEHNAGFLHVASSSPDAGSDGKEDTQAVPGPGPAGPEISP